MAVWGSELCCACLVRSHPDTMYSLADAETNKLYKECTNIRIFYYEQSRYLCLMCYKQCEIWKCFKTRCQASRALIGRCMEDQQQNPTQSQPASSSQSEDFPENVIIKQEPVDYFMDDEITVGPAYTLNEDPEEDPLEDGEKTVKRKRKRKRQSRKSFGEDFPFNDKSSSCEVTKSSKTKPPIPAPPPLAPVGKLKKEKRESGSLKLKISLSPEKKKVNPGAIQVSCTSIDQYMKTYNDFISWKDRTQPEDREIDEDLLLDFFQSILPIYSGTTMNNKLSHMVNTMGTFHNVDVNKFQRLRDFVRSTREQKSIIMLTPPPQQQPPKKKPKANESLDESGGGGDQLESNGEEADSLWTNMF